MTELISQYLGYITLVASILAVSAALLCYGMYETMKLNIKEQDSLIHTLRDENIHLEKRNLALESEKNGLSIQFRVIHERIDKLMDNKRLTANQKLNQINAVMETDQ